jgi:formate--tetrahydrofolate ligase
MEDINLHFTGDMHAVTTTHNLLSSLVDNHLHHQLTPALDPRGIVWKRVLDMNDRALRAILVGLEGRGVNGVLREDGFEITAASEVMAVLCLADGPADLKERLGRIIVGYDSLKRPVTAAELGAAGAMAALLKHALSPNLVQTIEGGPVLVHGGPFANIAHGCNSLIATRMAMRLADYTVTEAGFGSDLGAEKFFDIKCRAGKIVPSAAVLVVTRRAVVRHGIANVTRHGENLRRFGIPVLVSVNRFLDDRDGDLLEIVNRCAACGLPAYVTDFRESGGAGGLALAEAVVTACETPGSFQPLYPLEMPLSEKIETIATSLYGADGVDYTAEGAKTLKQVEDLGFGGLPVCIAKTPLSLSDDPQRPGVPEGFRITVSAAKVSAGAGFVVVYTGKVMTMPGLPHRPAALDIDIDGDGNISGLF